MIKGRGVQLGGASDFEVRFVGPVVRGNYAWYLVMFVIFMGFGGAVVGDVLKSFRGGGGGGQCKPQEGGLFLIGKEGGILTICNTAETLLLGTLKDFIGYLLSLNFCCFTCFVSTEIGKAKSAS